MTSHVFGDCRLTDRDPELQQLAVKVRNARSRSGKACRQAVRPSMEHSNDKQPPRASWGLTLATVLICPLAGRPRRVSPADRATSAPSIAKKQWSTRPSTSRLGASARRGDLCPLRRQRPRPCRSVRSRNRRGTGRGARGCLQGRPRVRGRGNRLHWSDSGGLGSQDPSATPPCASRDQGCERRH